MNPTVIISAYERVVSLQRLLNSVKLALSGNEKVIIVVGKKEDNSQVLRVAKQFSDCYSNSEIVTPKHTMNLVEQFLFIGDMTNSENSIILLEDDLMVSNSFFDFSKSALFFFENDPKVAGICLNALPFNGYTKFPFTPVDDGNDTFFAQIPFYHGQAYTQKMWKSFRNWLEHFDGNLDHPELPKIFYNFPPDEWFPAMSKYLIESNKYFVFPRISYAVNFGEIGKHFSNKTNLFQTPIAHSRIPCKFSNFERSSAIYDIYQELDPSILKPYLGIENSSTLGVDINGGRTIEVLEKFDFILTTKPIKSPKVTFDGLMKPLEENVLHEIPGNFIHLGSPTSIMKTRISKRLQFAKLMKYHFPMHGIGYWKRIEVALLNKIWIR